MASDSSFSSLESTISYYSANNDFLSSTSMEYSESDSNSESTQPIRGENLWDGSLSTDSNIDNLTDLIVEELAKSQSCLYDIKVEITMEVPKEETFNKPDMLRAAVYTICGDIIFKHQQWKAMGPSIAYQLGRAVDPTSCMWISVQQNHLLFHGKYKISGHCVQLDDVINPSIVFDTIKFHDYICATNAKLSYTADIFITPAVAGAEMIYTVHGFNTAVDNYYHKKKHLENILNGHKAEKLKNYDHHLAWATVYNILEEYRQNIAKQNKFMNEYGFCF